MTFKQLPQPSQIIYFECFSTMPLWLLSKKTNFVTSTTSRFKKEASIFKVMETVLGFSRRVLHLKVQITVLKGEAEEACRSEEYSLV